MSYRFILYDTLSNEPLSLDADIDVKALTFNLNSADTFEGMLLKPDYFSLQQPMPLATGCGIVERHADGTETVIFNGFVSDVATTDVAELVNLTAVSWRAWPIHHYVRDQMAFVNTDVGAILAQLWCSTLTPNERAPQSFTYEPVMTGKVVGTPATATEKEQAWRAAPFTKSNVGDLVGQLNSLAKIVDSERHELGWNGVPFTTIMPVVDKPPEISNAVFSTGPEGNVAPGTLFRVTAADMASDVLGLGNGQGPARHMTWIDSGMPGVPRTTRVHEDTTPGATRDDLRASAQKAANANSRSLKFDRLTVAQDSELAPHGSYHVGRLVKLVLEDWGLFENCQIETLTTDLGKTPTVELGIKQYWG